MAISWDNPAGMFLLLAFNMQLPTGNVKEMAAFPFSMIFHYSMITLSSFFCLSKLQVTTDCIACINEKCLYESVKL